MLSAVATLWTLLRAGASLRWAPYAVIAMAGLLVLGVERLLTYRQNWRPAVADFVDDGAFMLLVQILLQLTEPGATVTGMVVDYSGKGVPDATVVLGLGAGSQHREEHMRQEWSALVLNTAADGSFVGEGMAPGRQLVTVWADGCTRTQDYVPCVAGQTATIVLTIVRGVTVTGTVRNEANDGMADVIVKCHTDADLAGPFVTRRRQRRV